jgi:hypothetical protein
MLVLGNLGLLAWIFIAFLNVYFYNQMYGLLYLVLESFIVYVILRRLGCSSCYLCKTCTSGFGRLTGAFFGKGFVKKDSVGNRIGVVVFFYFLLFPVPTAALFFSIIEFFSLIKLFMLICLLTLTVYSFTTWYNSSTVNRK